MNILNLFRRTSNLDFNRTAENYANQKISQFKTGVFISVLFYGLAAMIIIGVILFVGFMVLKNL
ncbi:MAG: hypothetical protein L0Y79_10015 [Chlorobi bacterium]|nr:hypothetical protein [Chlorobiota bacterium]MCI0715204.1 hypothetical protein [Chlorobiota bacterium]